MEGTNVTTSANTSTEHGPQAPAQPNFDVQRQQLVQTLPSLQPGLDYYYEDPTYSADHHQNCLLFSAVSYPYATAATAAPGTGKHDESYVCYQLMNNVHSYRWYVPKMAQQLPRAAYQHKAVARFSHQQAQLLHPRQQQRYQEEWSPTRKEKMRGDRAMPVDADKEGGPEGDADGTAAVSQIKVSNKMHPVQLLHQIFRKEAFVMEYERINDGPFSRVRVTYKVNGRAYVAEATRLKEARRLCAKQVLRDQLPHLDIESDDDIPRVEYDVTRFDNKHPVQILYQIFRYEPMEMHCEEEGAAHFAKHIFTFVIRGVQYKAKAETIKEAKRRAAILALNEYYKQSEGHSPPEAAATVTTELASSTVTLAPSNLNSAPVQHALAPPLAAGTDQIGAT